MPDGLDPWALAGVDASGAGISASLLPLYQRYVSQGIPPDVARYMTIRPWTVEGTARAGGWPTPYAGQRRDEAEMKAQPDMSDAPSWRNPRYQRDVSYQPGGAQMPGMPWDDQGAGDPQSPLGNAQNLPPWMRNMNAQQLQAFLALAQNRGTGGMQFGQGGAMMGPRGPVQQAPGTQNLINQLQGGGQQQGMGLSPQMLALLQYYQQQQGQQNGLPQGGGIDLMQLLGGGPR